MVRYRTVRYRYRTVRIVRRRLVSESGLFHCTVASCFLFSFRPEMKRICIRTVLVPVTLLVLFVCTLHKLPVSTFIISEPYADPVVISVVSC